MYADVSEESRYMLRNEGVRENELLIWHSNCMTARRNDSNVPEHSNPTVRRSNGRAFGLDSRVRV
jgi:hypothetical protein